MMATGTLAENNMLDLVQLTVTIGAGPMQNPHCHQRKHPHQQQGGEAAQKGWGQVEQAHSSQKFAEVYLRVQA